MQVVTTVHPPLRSADVIGRLGGEALVALLPETSLDVAQVVAECIRSAINAMAQPRCSP